MKNYVSWAIMAPGRIAAKMAEAMNGEAAGGKIRLHAVASRNVGRAEEFAKKWNFQKAYGSYGELLADPEVDAVYVANPHAFHLESVIACLEAGKHVLCEKPAGCSREQLDRMTALARDRKRFFMEAMWTAFNPCVAEVRRAIQEGLIGGVKNVDSRFCNRNPYDPDDRNYAPALAGGALLDLGIYDIYFAMMIAGFSPVVSRSSQVRMLGGVDAWNAVSLTFGNGIATSFQSAMDIPSTGPTHDAVIYGTKGFITVENFFMTQKADVFAYTKEGGNESTLVREIRCPFRTNGYEYELVHATDCILAGKTESDVHGFRKSEELCSVMDALRADWGMKYPWE